MYVYNVMFDDFEFVIVCVRRRIPSFRNESSFHFHSQSQNKQRPSPLITIFSTNSQNFKMARIFKNTNILE